MEGVGNTGHSECPFLQLFFTLCTEKHEHTQQMQTYCEEKIMSRLDVGICYFHRSWHFHFLCQVKQNQRTNPQVQRKIISNWGFKIPNRGYYTQLDTIFLFLLYSVKLQ